MYRDRSISINRIIRDIKRHINTDFVTEMADGTLLYTPNPTIRITDILLHAACWEPWYDDKYIVRVDEFAVNYINEQGIECTYRRNFRYDCWCDDPDIHSTITIVYDNHSTEPFIRTTVGQKSIIQYIKTNPSNSFWIRVKAEQDSFKPKDKHTPVMYHKLTIAEGFV